MPESFAPYVPAFFGLIGTVIGASISGYYTHLNSNLAKKLKQKDLYELLISELRTLSTHCELSAVEILSYCDTSLEIIPQLRMAKYYGTGMVSLELKEMYILNNNLCQDIMKIILCVRNTDILIDHTIKIVEAVEATPQEKIQTSKKKAKNAIEAVSRRLAWMANLADAIRLNLEKHIRNPAGYNEPQIQWGKPISLRQRHM